MVYQNHVETRIFQNKLLLNLLSQIIKIIHVKTNTMKFNDDNDKPKQFNMMQKIGLCVLVLSIILYYVLSIQFLTS